MNLVMKGISGVLLALPALSLCAKSGNLFQITRSGAALGQSVSFTLCLSVNGKNPLSCQVYSTQNATMAIKTTVPNHVYRHAGIKFNTPGFSYTSQGLHGVKHTIARRQKTYSGYTPIGTVSDTQTTTGTVSSQDAPPAATTLSVSSANLALSIDGLMLNGQPSGQPRTLTLTNTGAEPASGLTINYPTWPTVTTASSNCGATLAPGAQCTITITPGNNPSSDCSNTGLAPTAGVITMSASNAAPITSNVLILGYGCIYQGGYIFAMTETVNPAASIGGKVVAETDQAPGYPGGVVWSSNGAGFAATDVSSDRIPGIAETSTINSAVPTYNAAQTTFNTTYLNESSFPFPSAGAFSSCNGAIDGACNSRNILALYDATYGGIAYLRTQYGIGGSPYTLAVGPTNASYYAAGRCSQLISGYTDWYLPAICEMGPASNGSGCTVGIQNIVDQLPMLLGTNPFDCAYAVNCLAGFYWSSTEFSGNSQLAAWEQDFQASGASQHNPLQKDYEDGVRCVRAFS